MVFITLKNYSSLLFFVKVSVIIPGFNEEEHIAAVVKEVLAQGFVPIVVDDGSLDETSTEAKSAGATVLRHVVNMGKGAAARTGCDYAFSKEKADVLVLIDADGQHRPSDIPRLLKHMKNRDIVFGFRVLDKNMPSVMRLGNWGITFLSRFLTGMNLRDTQSGFRIMTRDAYQKVRWSSNDYGMESEMIAKAAKHKLKFAQVRIDTIYLDNFKGTTVFDGFKIIFRMFKWKLFS